MIIESGNGDKSRSANRLGQRPRNGALFAQCWGKAPRNRALLAQCWGTFPPSRALLAQCRGMLPPNRASLAQCQMPPDGVPPVVGQCVPVMCGQSVPVIFSQSGPGDRPPTRAGACGPHLGREHRRPRHHLQHRAADRARIRALNHLAITSARLTPASSESPASPPRRGYPRQACPGCC